MFGGFGLRLTTRRFIRNISEMACSACQRRKKLLLAKLAAKKAKGKTVQAAAIGAVITTTGLVGKLIGDQDEGTQEAPPVSDPKQPG